MKVIVVIMLTAILQAKAETTFGQKINLNEKNATLSHIIKKIRQQSGYDFVYNENLVENINNLKIRVVDGTVAEALEQSLKGQELTYSIEKKVIYIKKVFTHFPTDRTVKQDSATTGKVLDAESKQPIQGVTITIKNTSRKATTNRNGIFMIDAPKGSILVFNYIGYASVERKVGNEHLTVLLTESVSQMEDVVITGIVNIDKKSFTGASTSFNAEELSRASNINLLTALKALDPSFQLPENIALGSNPNILREVVLRGGNNLVDTRQAGTPDRFNFEPNPNSPLFVIDGFETTLQRVNDLDMNRIENVTLLKDASATAMYGSKGANGVVVIELKRPRPGKLMVSYNLVTSLETPDLSAYDLMNAREKFELEDFAGVFNYGIANEGQNQMDLVRASRLKAVNQGINTDWLAKPVQNGFGQRHSVSITGGEQALTYAVNLSYDQRGTAMKGSARNTTTANTSLSYRSGKLRIQNDLTLGFNVAKNSPYGKFSQYGRLNPYWTPYDNQGNIKAFLEEVYDPQSGARISILDAYDNLNGVVGRAQNPLYNATLNIKDQTSYRNIINNFQATYDVSSMIQLNAQFSYTTQPSESDVFLPAAHTSFDNTALFQRGSYDKMYGQSENITGNLNARFAKNINKSLVNLSFRASGQSSSTASQAIRVIGFTNPYLDQVTLGSTFAPNSKPTGTENIFRSLGFLTTGSYTYDNRYIVEGTLRADGASNVGSQKRFTPFWAVGGRWNVHNETFLKKIKAIDQLSLKYSLGTTGTQGFSSSQAITTSTYFPDREYRGVIPVSISGFGNTLLQWAKTTKENYGFEANFFNRINLSGNYFIERTKGSNTFISTAPSTGFSGYTDNMGDVLNKGFELYSRYTLYKNTASRNQVSLFANFLHVKNRIEKISPTIQALNNRADNNRSNVPIPRYSEGQSRTAIWGIQSLGIDPATGNEVFINRDGSLTTNYNPTQQIIIGDSNPQLSGSFGTNMEIKGIGLNVYFNFSLGGDAYNSTLVEKVENINITQYNADRRVGTARWRTPGDISLFRGIVSANDILSEGGTFRVLPSTATTYVTSRFIQRNNLIEATSAQLYYRLSDKLNKKLGLNNTRVNFTAQNPFGFYSIRRERGLDYPFAHNFSFQFTTTF